MTTIFTIGHSDHTMERFVALLRQYGIETVVDVRSQPYSRRAPQYQKRVLARALEEAGIGYVFAGAELGGRPKGAAFYRAGGRLDPVRRAKAEGFREGIDGIVATASSRRSVILCAEEDPTRCHRRSLVSPALRERGIEVLHLRGDGSVVSDVALETDPEQLQLFP
jgi:uncharacterized protein (DUF488 family)